MTIADQMTSETIIAIFRVGKMGDSFKRQRADKGDDLRDQKGDNQRRVINFHPFGD